MLTAPSRPAYHHPTTLPPLPGSQLSLGAPRVDLIAASQPATRVGSDPEPIFRELRDTHTTADRTSTEEAVKEQEEERGGEDQKENRHDSDKS